MNRGTKISDDEIRSFVLNNWLEMSRDNIGATLKVNKNRVTDAYEYLRGQSLVPSVSDMRRIKTKRQKRAEFWTAERIEYITSNWKQKTQVEIARYFGVGRYTIASMYKKLADDGVIPTGREIQSIKSQSLNKAARKKAREQEMRILYSKWVPKQYVNNNCRWLAA